MTGGGGCETKVEVLRADGHPLCSLPDLPGDRYWHTQSGLEACGGEYPGSGSCVRFNNGVWSESHSLDIERYRHSAWTSSLYGTVLLGGHDGWRPQGQSSTSTVLLTEDGNTQPSFRLRYETM